MIIKETNKLQKELLTLTKAKNQKINACDNI
jgi:hypothetical protein